MKSILAAFLLVVAAMGLAILAEPAAARTTHAAMGGSGDRSELDECAPGQYLVGVSIRAGLWWDQVEIACASPMANGGFGPHTFPRPARGGNGGRMPTLYKCKNSVMVSAHITLTKQRQVAYVTLGCSANPQVQSKPTSVPTAGSQFSEGQRSRQDCPVGEAGTGFRINFGQHVNALGLVCDTYNAPAPVVVAAPSPVARPVPCPATEILLDGKCQAPPILPGTNTGTGGGFIQMFPTCAAGSRLDPATKNCVAEAPQPAPVDAGMQTTSICGLAGGVATVVISNPAVTTLNVRDKPNGNILTQIPEGSQVNVVGGCGAQIAAGIVAGAGGGQPPVPGWCAISSPLVGCVSEQFLVAGIAGGQAPAAGIVATQPQSAPTHAFPPTARSGNRTARLRQGANVRNGPSSKNTKVIRSLPAGSIITAVECTSQWCRLVLPGQRDAWVFREFLEFGDFGHAGFGGGDSVTVTIEIGDQQAGGGGGFVPPQGSDMQTASTCGVPGGTATVVISNPAITTLNVRDKPAGNILTQIPEGTQVNVVGGCGARIAAGIVAQKPGAGGGQPVPGWCAISSPVIGCVSQDFLVAGVAAAGQAPAAGIVAAQPRRATAASFTGAWNATAQGSGYVIMLNQNGSTVSGNYTGEDGSRGRIDGTVSGNVLRFSWRQADGLGGAGRFALSDDGHAFTGSYTLGSNPDVAEGSWNGRRRR